MDSLTGKVALITGGARGMGRSHALRLAGEGANLILIDVCRDDATLNYPLATPQELEETGEAVRALGVKAVCFQADVAKYEELEEAVDAGRRELGGIDIVVANAGFSSYGRSWELTEEQWQATLGVNLTGAWHTSKAVLPDMIERGQGGSLVFISSTGGRRGVPNAAHYVSAKHGVVGLTRSIANEVGRYSIRANSIHPTGVPTEIIMNEAFRGQFGRSGAIPTEEELGQVLQKSHLLKVPWVEPIDISNAVLWLASDQARYVTGVALPIDAGYLARAG